MGLFANRRTGKRFGGATGGDVVSRGTLQTASSLVDCSDIESGASILVDQIFGGAVGLSVETGRRFP
ncbi:hypothetical protein D5S18_12425 [Nocardia panacis]|uniref:Uncharacterized protein n=1 Tax=Nocardia panacis TaxID=2340916 RepID=A0A3A4JZR8_9NOCA|nr:hypothetical protein [Nocardia panacis]RJO76995.1 hypothetical protein D5S18_12425 [Nocardia panacis]